MRIGVTGATGLIGSALCQSLIQDNHEVVVLARNPEKARQNLSTAEVITWEATSGPPPEQSMDGLDAVVHLAGEAIAEGRWTAGRKRAIRESRVTGTRNLVQAILRSKNPPKVLLSGSAIGYYGPRGDQLLEETSSPGKDFLAEICRQWESEAMRATESGVRVVLLRTGLVLSTEGGALPRILPPFRMFVGGPLGSGKQWMSWIHIQDEIEAIRYAVTKDEIEGPINLVEPNPVTNREFSRELGRVLGRPAFFRVPGFALRLLFGEMAESLLLQGQRVLSKKLEQAGYKFRFPQLNGALLDLID
ncbi:TIGR01777 family oxidoreductase [Acidobacteria bacterium AH-259-L09]|nr:TIGR01777 family oxidoreductase [Acidobacteria bacterium AH-259-L09]